MGNVGLIGEQASTPDRLISGDRPMPTTAGVTILDGEGIVGRGTILGQIQVGAGVFAANGGNTGNPTCGAVATKNRAKVGVYTITCDTATTFNVVDPFGARLSEGVFGTAYADRIGFTITAGGTACVAGDYFTITVAAPAADANGVYKYRVVNSANTDGSQTAVAIFCGDGLTTAASVDATAADALGSAWIQGEFNADFLFVGGADTVAQHVAELAAVGIIVRRDVGIGTGPYAW